MVCAFYILLKSFFSPRSYFLIVIAFWCVKFGLSWISVTKMPFLVMLSDKGSTGWQGTFFPESQRTEGKQQPWRHRQLFPNTTKKRFHRCEIPKSVDLKIIKSETILDGPDSASWKAFPKGLNHSFRQAPTVNGSSFLMACRVDFNLLSQAPPLCKPCSKSVYTHTYTHTQRITYYFCFSSWTLLFWLSQLNLNPHWVCYEMRVKVVFFFFPLRHSLIPALFMGGGEPFPFLLLCQFCHISRMHISTSVRF